MGNLTEPRNLILVMYRHHASHGVHPVRQGLKTCVISNTYDCTHEYICRGVRDPSGARKERNLNPKKTEHFS